MLPQTSKHWDKIHKFLRDYKGIKYFFIALAIIIITGATVWAILHNAPTYPPGSNSINAKPKPKLYYSPLTGEQVKNQAATQQAVTAIMIENSPDARPQSGLKKAGVVFEAIAEGGITRFLALYQQAKPQLIGPVRSVRPYYVSWLAPFQASVAHVGGSYNALKTVRNGHYRDIDEFFNPQAYWRSTDRWAPHNVYTSFAKLDQLNKSKGYKTSHFKGFVRVKPDDKKSVNAEKKVEKTAAKANHIDISISSAEYNVHYNYSKSGKAYVRYEGGVPHVDREKGQITPKVVIAIKVPTKIAWEDGYREQMTTIGRGQAYIFQHGIVRKATWSKKSQFAQIRFLDSDGKDIPLLPGQTWITAIPIDQRVTWNK